MNRISALVAAAILAACGSSDGTGVDPDAISREERAAVQGALNTALARDSLYPTLAAVVFPFIDRASRLPVGTGDTLRLVGIQLDIDATQDTTRVVARLSAVLGWRGFRTATGTVDTVVFVIGSDSLKPPITDAISVSFSPDTLGTGTGFVIHPADSTYWLARAGVLQVDAVSYGGGTSQTQGGLALTTFRGSLSGSYAITAKLVPDSSSTVTSGASFPGSIRALKVRIRGTY